MSKLSSVIDLKNGFRLISCRSSIIVSFFIGVIDEILRSMLCDPIASDARKLPAANTGSRVMGPLPPKGRVVRPAYEWAAVRSPSFFSRSWR